MSPALLPHRAEYALLGPDGAAAGHEELDVQPLATGYIVSAELATAYPVAVSARVQWELDFDLVTRLLLIKSTDAWGAEAELELTITGNGLLAHRRGLEGPTQVELGWGPRAELDYLSMAFPLVLNARRRLAPGAAEVIDMLHVQLEDLVPMLSRQEVRRPAGAGHVLTCRALETGHVTTYRFDPDGTVTGQDGYARRVELPATPAPTK